MQPLALAAFISPHGFGHAARAIAVLNAAQERVPELHVHVFTTVPEWFFSASLNAPHTLHSIVTDVGLVQHNALEEDFPATLRALEAALPPPPERVEALARTVSTAGCQLVLADIAPLGIAVAEAAGVPSVLVENFTWDWIYAPYVKRYPGFQRSIDSVAELNARATVHVQTEPVCCPVERARRVAPIARPLRAGRATTREQLALEDGEALVLITMGGTRWSMAGLERLGALPIRVLLLAQPQGEAVPDNVTLLPPRSGHYHPDLVAAADVVVGKLGYSTVAEALQTGTRFVYVERPRFAESEVLADYLSAAVPATRLSQASFRSDAWVDAVAAVLQRPILPPLACTGAAEVAAILGALLGRERGTL